MAKTTNWKFYVTPNFVASQRNNSFKTGSQVKNFAVKNQVSCGWIKTAGSSTRHFLIEVNSFQKAYTTVAKSAGSSKKTGTRGNAGKGSKTGSNKPSYTSNSWSKSGNSNRQRGWTRSSRRAA